MTAAPVIKGNTSGFLPTGASLSISKWRLREIGVWSPKCVETNRPFLKRKAASSVGRSCICIHMYTKNVYFYFMGPLIFLWEP